MKKENKKELEKNKIIWFGAGGVLIIILLLVVVFLNKEENTNTITEKPSKEDFAKSGIQNISAKIDSIRGTTIEATKQDGEKIILEVPQEGASFIKQVKKEDGGILLENIGLLNIPKGELVNIQYDGQNNWIRMIEVK